jgi:integrase
MTINELALQIVKEMQKAGYADYTAWNEYSDCYVPIIRLHEQRGKSEFDLDLVEDYTRSIEGKMESGKISAEYYRRKKVGIKRMIEFKETGKIERFYHIKGTRFVLSDYYEKILTEFLSCDEYTPNTRGDVTWVARKYFAWLMDEKYDDLNNIGATEIQRFMRHCFSHMKSNGIHNVKLYMKKLYRYLKKSGYSENNYEALFSFKISRESKMSPAVSHEEILSVLSVIDRRIPKGKRDYAMILLGVVTGLRAIDIARLKLSDIDWKNGEIKIVQAKTAVPLALPLTKDVGEAVQDYILHGRQRVECDAVFLRMRAPATAFCDSVSIGDIYDDYCKQAGIYRKAFDGKGFHSLRRSVGKNMVISGIPVTTVAQILGHGNINSTKKYISLDSRHLKECALDFSGIEEVSR